MQKDILLLSYHHHPLYLSCGGDGGREVRRETIIQKYIEHPYMKRYLDGKIQKNLAEVV